MSRKVLGRGLSALLGNETNENDEDELMEIDLDLIKPNGEQPRTRFEEDALEDLAQSIKANGIVQPIIVRKKRREIRNCRGRKKMESITKSRIAKNSSNVKNIGDEKLLELALIENIQRQELNAIEEARAYKNLVEKIGLTQEMIAERVGKNRTVVTTFLRLLKLPNDIHNL